MQKKSEYPTDTQIDAADCSVCVIVGAMVGAMRTDSMELEAMSPHLVAWKLQGFFTQLSQCRHLQILDGATFFTDEVIVIIGVGVKTGMSAAKGQLLNLSVLTERAQIAIYGTQTNMGHLFTYFLIHPVCGGMAFCPS
jgi:hypothetical protein